MKKARIRLTQDGDHLFIECGCAAKSRAVTYAQTLDGVDALPYEDSGQGRHRDEFARARIQPQEANADTRYCRDNKGDKDGKSLGSFRDRPDIPIATKLNDE